MKLCIGYWEQVDEMALLALAVGAKASSTDE
jgi:hypothetical protein